MLMLARYVSGVTAGINPPQQREDCERGGNDANYYKNLFKNDINRLGTTFDNFCTTEDLSTSTCCIEESLGAIIVGFKIYEMLVYAPMYSSVCFCFAYISEGIIYSSKPNTQLVNFSLTFIEMSEMADSSLSWN